MARARKSVLTVRDRDDILREVEEKSKVWILMGKEELAERIKERCFYSVDPEKYTKEDLLRTLFLLHMKRMVS